MSEFKKKEFSELLERAKGDRSIAKFGKTAGVDPGYISRFINLKKEKPPSPEVLYKLARVAYNEVDFMLLMEACGFIMEFDKGQLGMTESYMNYFSVSGDEKFKILERSSNRIKRLVKNDDMPIVEICKLIVIPREEFRLLEQGKELLDVTKMVLIARYFDVSLDYILGETNNTKRYGYNSDDWEKDSSVNQNEEDFIDPELKEELRGFSSWNKEDKQELINYLKVKKMTRGLKNSKSK